MKVRILWGIFGLITAQDSLQYAEYDLSVYIRNRYVVNTVQVRVENTGPDASEYKFAVDLEKNEFISSLEMEIGNKTRIGEVKEKEEANKMFDKAKQEGKSVAKISKEESESNSFQTLISIPSNTTATIRLKYEYQLRRSRNEYKYSTKLKTFNEFKQIKIDVVIDEERKLTKKNVKCKNKETDNLNPHSTLNFHDKKFDETLEISYDVERPTLAGGDFIIQDGYFIHFIAPEDLPPLDKDIIFMIDRSGSMSGQSIKQVKLALETILDQMSKEGNNTNFLIGTFEGSEATFMKDDFIPVNWLNIIQAQNYASDIETGGSTPMMAALLKSLNKYEENSKPKLLFFLTDGQPTDAQWPEIHKMFEEKNENVNSIVFSFAIGSGAPYEEFEKISLQTGGVARQLFTDSDTAEQLTGFYSEMAMPIIHNFQCAYRNTKKETTLCSDSTLFRGQELFSIGKIENCRRKPQLRTDANDVLAESEILVDKCRKSSKNGPNLERIFTYMKLQKLLDEYKYNKKDQDKIKKEIISLSLKHNFVTEFTTMIVVDEDKEIELPPEVLQPEHPIEIMYDMSSRSSFFPRVNAYGSSHSAIPSSRSFHSRPRNGGYGYYNAYSPVRIGAQSPKTYNRISSTRQRMHAMIVQPPRRKTFRTMSTSYGYTSTTTTTTTSTPTTTTRSTTHVSIAVVDQSKMTAINQEFSNLLKSSLFRQHLTEVKSGAQIIKIIEFELPPKIKMQFILDKSGKTQKICLDTALFDHDIAKMLFKRDLASKLAGLNNLEKATLSC